MTSRVNFQFGKIRINRVKDFVEGESHNPVGVVRTVLRLLEIGEREVCFSLFVLMRLRSWHVGKHPPNPSLGGNHGSW